MVIDSKLFDELKTMEVEEREIRELVTSRIRREFRKNYGIYPEDKLIKIDQTIEISVLNLAARMTKAFGNLENARIFYEFHDLRFSLISINEAVELRRYGNSSNAEILSMVRYATSGILDPDYAEVNKITDTYGIRYDNHMFEITINGAKVRSFKNGKVLISGLSQEQKNRIKTGFDIVTQYRNVEV